MAIRCTWCRDWIEEGEKYFTCAACGGQVCSERCARLHTNSVHRHYGRLEMDNSWDRKKKGGCFISTAICLHEGRADDCEELQTLRRFRDEILLASRRGRLLVERYYKTAPAIVEAIQRTGQSEMIYPQLRRRYLDRVLDDIAAGRNREAIDRYQSMIDWLLHVSGGHSTANSGDT